MSNHVSPGTSLGRCSALIRLVQEWSNSHSDGTRPPSHVAMLRGADGLYALAKAHGAARPVEAILAEMVRDLELDPNQE